MKPLNALIAIETLIGLPQLGRELGVGGEIVRRWIGDRTLNLPRPIVIGGERFFDWQEIERWKADQVEASRRAERRAAIR